MLTLLFIWLFMTAVGLGVVIVGGTDKRVCWARRRAAEVGQRR